VKATQKIAGVSLALVLVSSAAVAQQQGPPGRSGEDAAPKVGDIAPLFTLKSLDGTSEWSLEEFRDSKPVVLFFGSYT
jgi:hypothetical protein